MEDPATDVWGRPIVNVLASRFNVQSCRQALYAAVLKLRLKRRRVTIDVQEIDAHYHIDLLEFAQFQLPNPEPVLKGLQRRCWIFGEAFTLVL
jgi:hypothetical protein